MHAYEVIFVVELGHNSTTPTTKLKLMGYGNIGRRKVKGSLSKGIQVCQVSNAFYI